MSKSALELVKIDPSTMVVQCNFVMDSIEIQREELFEKEVENIMKVYMMSRNDAEDFAEKTLPDNSLVYKYAEEVHQMSYRYLTKCIEYLDNGCDKKLSILREDYRAMINFDE